MALAKQQRRIGPLIVGLIAGLVVGGGGVGLAWVLGGNGGGGTGSTAAGPADLARAACEAIRGGQLPVRPQDLSQADMYRWTGAGSLATAAAKEDGQYQPLNDALTKVYTAIQQLDTNSPEVATAVGQAHSFCTARFP